RDPAQHRRRARARPARGAPSRPRAPVRPAPTVTRTAMTNTPSPDESALDQAGYRVRFGWGERDAALLAPLAARVVVVDVLRFTTAVSVANEQGAVVYP